MRPLRLALSLSIALNTIFLAYSTIPGLLELENYQRKHNDTQSDIIFLLDTSGSLRFWGQDGFADEKVFVNNLLSHIRVSMPSTRVSIVTFGTDSVVDINYVSPTIVNPSMHKCNFKRSFASVRFRSGMTNMRAGFDRAWDIIFGRLSVNKRPLKQVKTAVFLLTDGNWNMGGDPAGMARNLKNAGIEVFCIGVTSGINSNVLRQLATDHKHAFHYSSFNKFRELSHYLRGDPYEKDWLQDQFRSLCGHCDAIANCACGLLSGEYKCACPKGYYGSGYVRDCHECPPSTYKSYLGHAMQCDACPAKSGHTKRGRQSRADCKCFTGYDGEPKEFRECKLKMCDKFPQPANSQIKGGTCKREYGSTCEVICDEGYELTGKGSRSCQLDSQGRARWSGQDVFCQRVECPPLTVKNANPNSGTCVGGDRGVLTYKTKCTYTCNPGYVLKGSLVRQCAHDKTWSGNSTVCEPLLCPKLNSISLSQVEPSSCVEGPSRYNSRCLFKCPSGYVFNGTSQSSINTRFCAADGLWTGKFSICLDNEPPKIGCPSNIVTNTSETEAIATVTWDPPTYSDNSQTADPTAELKLVSTHQSPREFAIGSHTVAYTATDSSGRAARCSFDIQVKDLAPPYFTNCPGDITVETTESEQRVSWDRVIFRDNSRVNPTVQLDHKPGSEFNLGETFVYYVATDQSGNVNRRCVFKVHVKAKACEAHPAPKNGALACNKWGISNSYCTVSCNNKFDFAFPPAITYMCGSGSWTSIPASRIPWPDCSVRYDPANPKVRFLGQFYYYSGDCREEAAQVQIKTNFLAIINQQFIPSSSYCRRKPADCTISNVNVYCGEAAAPVRRRRRSVREVYVKVDFLAKEKPGTTSTFADLKKVLQDSIRPEIDTIAKSTDWSSLRTSTDMAYRKYSLSNAEAYCSDSGAVVGKCSTLLTNCDGSWNKPHSSCQCNKGSGTIEKCIRCPAGSHYSGLQEKCVLCKAGTYQPKEGYLRCYECPKGTWTVGEDAKNFTACRAKCGKGYSSYNGLAPCFACSFGKYTAGDMNKQCTACPQGTTTILPAARGREDCGMQCSPGTFSSNGVEPCSPCKRGSYTTKTGSMACDPCEGLKSTHSPGADSVDLCVVTDECASNPCNNRAKCVDLKHDFRCECPAGYTGKKCEIEKDECLSDPCFQGATCIDKVHGYECVCAEGYSGQNCDIPSGLCSTNVCQNSGKCIKQGASFVCECREGFSGTYCEMKRDYCLSRPCENEAFCRSVTSGFQCTCRPGYSGDRCQFNNDDCVAQPCQNNGTCADGVEGYTCNCLKGYTGAQCEVSINECLPNPCKNGARCVDKVNGFECVCRPTFSGTLCNTKVSSDFDISFPLRVATSASVVRGIPDLRAFTIAFWMRTRDRENPGTPLSYSTTHSGKVIDNALVLEDYGAFSLTINNKQQFIGESANDGHWHHVAVTWDGSTGAWFFYKDGKEVKRYTTGFQAGAVIRGGGYLVLGQEQDTLGGGFSPDDAFTGDISQMNIWNKALPANDILNIALNCRAAEGNVGAWADFLAGLGGVYTVTPRSYVCDVNSPLRRFTSVKNSHLPNNNDKQLDGKSQEQCAHACESETAFPCRSFDYDKQNRRCYLSRDVVSKIPAASSSSYDYYEMNCLDALGVENSLIGDAQLTASSSLDGTSQPTQGRLNTARAVNIQGVPNSRGAWSPSTSSNQYLQVDLAKVWKITGVATQGVDGLQEWVTSYKLQYSVDGSSWTYHPKTLQGNTDSSTTVRNELLSFKARYVRYRPQTWNGRVALRVEIYGCSTASLLSKIGGRSGTNECANSPCQHGATCVDLYHGYRCLCTAGYESKNCQTPSSCEDPSAPLNGRQSSHVTTHGSTITFACNSGFALQGSSTRTCTNGQWTGTKTTCTDADECSSGTSGCAQRCTNTFGSFKCSCRAGYRLNNDHKTCSDVDECALGACSHKCSNKAGGFRCMCPVGMELASPSLRTCRDRDECLSGNGGCAHTCRNGYQTHNCDCRGGYNLASDKKQCTEIRCPVTAAPVLGSQSITGDRILGNTVTFKCQSGYKIVGSSRRTCQANKRWSGTQPRCEAIRCVTLGSPDDGSVRMSKGYNYGSLATYVCNSGFALKGVSQRRCKGEGKWSGQPPRCVLSHCPKLVSPAHGKIEGYRWELGATLRVACVQGYKVHPQDAAFRTCQSNRRWSGVDPTCQLINCGDPGTPWHGYRQGSVFTYGRAVTYSCRLHHHMEGDSRRTCLASGHWSGELPKCLERSCGNPGAPDHGIKIGKNHTYGASLQFTCDSGYTLHGSQNRVCQTNGQWTGTQPTCQIKSCGDPGSLANGFRVGNTFTYGAKVVFDCNPGFRLRGSIIRECQADGTWSGTAASCSVSSCGSVVHGPSGTIQSTNFPNNYGNNEYCTWEIRVPLGKKVKIQFTELRTEQNGDYVFVYDTGKTEPVVAFSGIKDKPRPLTSTGNSIRVRFISNAQGVNNGFKLTYKQTDCGGISSSSTGEIRSPGFPSGYPPNLSCTWLIFAPKRKIALRLNEFQTENAYDRLEVAHGPYVTSPYEIAWSGASPLAGDVITSQYMWVHFVTSAMDDRSYKGFRATYRNII